MCGRSSAGDPVALPAQSLLVRQRGDPLLEAFQGGDRDQEFIRPLRPTGPASVAGVEAQQFIDRHECAHHQTGDVDRGGFLVLVVHAGVADVRIGQGHDLLTVGGVGQYLLVTGHRGIEDDLANGLTVGANRPTAKHAAIFEN